MPNESTHVDLLIVGTGSGNSIPAGDFDGWSIGMVGINDINPTSAAAPSPRAICSRSTT